METDAIKRTVTQLLIDSFGAADDNASVATRAAEAEARFPDFAKRYPTFLVVCCASTTKERQDETRRMLGLMLSKLGAIRVSGDGTLDKDDMFRASRDVGQTIYEMAGVLPPSRPMR